MAFTTLRFSLQGSPGSGSGNNAPPHRSLHHERTIVLWTKPFPGRQGAFPHKSHVPRTTHEESTPRRAVSLTSRQVGGASFLIGPMILPRESDRGVLRPCLFSRMPVLARSFTGFAFLFPVNPAWFGRPSRAGDSDRHPSRRVSCSTPSPVHATCLHHIRIRVDTLISPASRVDAHILLRVFARARRERR